MQIFVDADACPVVDIVETIAEKYNISTTLLCDTNHILYSDYSEVIVVSAGADAVLNICSSVGEVADSVQDVAKYTGIPIVRIDEEMCRDAVRNGEKIVVMATLPTTLEPTKNTIKRVAREMNKHVELIDCLVDGAFGLDQEQFKTLMTEYAGKVADEADVILFAQGSMAYCEDIIREKYGKMVASSPRYGAPALRDALIAKGMIK